MKKKLLKIKAFFKKRKKIFKPILYTLGGISSFVVIWLILIIISIGGQDNKIRSGHLEELSESCNDQLDGQSALCEAE